jgi:uncharacterized protein
LQGAIDGLLRLLWTRGCFAGATAAQAYFVRCNADNNPPDVRDRGNLIADVGIAPAVPYEFVLVRIGREGNQLEIAEVGSTTGGF